MPSPLRFFRVDPNKKGRGRGVYYLRGKGVYSKYNIERDRFIKAKNYKIHKIGLPRASTIKHTGDGRLPR